MEDQLENLEFGNFGDLTPEEFAKVSQILHGGRNDKESKVEFPWDSSLATDFTHVVEGQFSISENVNYGQGDHFIRNVTESPNIAFVGSAEKPYQGNIDERVTFGFTNERSAQSDQVSHHQNVQQGFFTQNTNEQLNQQTDYSRNYGGKQFRPSTDGHVTVSVNDGAYQYDYTKQLAESNQIMPNEIQQAQLTNIVSDIQPSQRTYERRNKKKRPPEYYKRVEAEIEAERQRQFGVNPNSENLNWNQQYVQNSQVDSYINSVPSLPPSDNFRNQNFDSQQQYMNYDTQNYSSHVATEPSTLNTDSLNRENRFPDNSLGQHGPITHHVNKPTYDRPVNVYRKPVSNFAGQSDQLNDLHAWQKHSNLDQSTNYVCSDVHDDPAVLSAGASTLQRVSVQEAASVSNFVPNNCDIERNSNQIYDNRTNSVNVISQELSDLSIQKSSAIENANNHHLHHASVPISQEETKPVTNTPNDQLRTDQNPEFPAIVPSNRPLNDGQNIFDNKAKTKELTPKIVSDSSIVPPGGTVDNNKVTVGMINKESISDDSLVEFGGTNIQLAQAAEAPKPKVSSWAGLFRNTETAKSAVTIPYYRYQGTGASSGTSASSQKEEEKKSKDVEKTPCEVTKDSAANMMGAQLASMKISHVQNALQPRGLINRGNWCYINATLQALLACPPFVNLMKKLATFHFEERGTTSTPVLDSLIEFVNEFSGFIRAPKGTGPQRGNKKGQEIITGSSFEPIRVYKMLEVVKANSSFKHGKQEDAEEFLSCILDGIHEEMSATINLNSGANNSATKSNGYLQEDSSSIADEEEVADESWEQVGPKKKSVQTRRADFARSPIAEIFTGYIRSAVLRKTAKESATLQPFFTLQLDIQSEKVSSVKDALEGLVSKESVGGFTCSQTNEELEILRKITLEELPPVLIMHLKFFVYDKDGGCQKLMKQIDYDIDLEITRDLLSPNVKTKLNHHQRSYKLFAVVYHHGEKSTGGHYTTAVFHSGIMGWINIDDSNIKMVSVSNVLRYAPPRIPYLLYYRRLDV